MPFKKSYLITSREVTPMESKLLRDSLAVALVALLKNDGKIIIEDDAVVRDGLPLNDYNVTANTWLTPALTLNTVATHVDEPLANNKYAGFWGVGSDDPKMVTVGIYLLRFSVGGTGGSTRGRFQLERMWAEETPVGYFSDPIVYHPQETVFIEVTPRTTDAAGVRLELFSLVAEPKGPFVS